MAKRNAPRSEARDIVAPAPPEATTRRARSGPAASRATSEGTTFEPATPEAVTSEQMASEAEAAGTAAYELSEEEIRVRAYHRYLERGGAPGMDFDDWLEAERELKTQK